MDTLIIHSDPEKTKVILDYLKTLNVDFELKKKNSITYDPKFVKKILNTRKEKSTRIDPNNLWNSIL